MSKMEFFLTKNRKCFSGDNRKYYSGVDNIGDDVFVVRDSNGEFKRVQVKSANLTQQKKSIVFQISISITRLSTPVTPELTLVFPVRSKSEKKWKFFFVISRIKLYELFVNEKIGSENKKGNVNFRFKFENNKLTSKSIDLSGYVNDWSKFPKIIH